MAFIRSRYEIVSRYLKTKKCQFNSSPFLAELKVILYEEGLLEAMKPIINKQDQDSELACAAILQNISEYRFQKGLLLVFLNAHSLRN